MPSRRQLPLAGLEVHQWLPTFAPGDAMGAAAVGFRRALRLLGATGDVFAEETALPSLVKPLSAFFSRPRTPHSVVLYHHGIASGLASALLHLEGPKGVVFHNVTPARFYLGTRLEEPLRTGRAQLAALAEGVDLSLGVSHFNAAELREAGHRNVRVVPLFVEPDRFEPGQADVDTFKRWSSGGRPTLLTVSRVVHHKRVDDVLSLFAELKRLEPRATLRIIGGFAAGHEDVRTLRARADAMGGVDFVGRVSHAQLVAAYRSADYYVSMSEHEGLGVPLLEAMASDLPVLAFGAAAVPETMGGRGLVFDTKHFAALAEVLATLQRDPALRSRLVEGQRERLADFSLSATVHALGEALAPFAENGPPPAAARARAKPKVAIVVQRYGEKVVGGAEAHARQLAHHLAARASVDVLTTCAADHLTWANVASAGQTGDGPVTVHRFAVDHPRRMREFNRLSSRLFGQGQDLVTEEQWLDQQGPVSTELFAAIAKAGQTHDAVIFFTALYAHTAWGLPLVAERALLVPTAHHEPPMAFHVYSDAFERARVLLCNTPEELDFIRARFPQAARGRVVGVGVEPMTQSPDDVERALARRGLAAPYLVYVGRLEAGKGVPGLVKAHQRLVKRFHDAPHLVLAGGGDLTPRGDRVHVLGRVDEAEKWALLRGALAAVVPSRYESLSLLALEAMAVGTPVLGNAASPVVAGQVQRSRAGVTYDEGDFDSFAHGVQALGEHREAWAKRATAFAAKYDWATVVDAYLAEIERLRS